MTEVQSEVGELSGGSRRGASRHDHMRRGNESAVLRTVLQHGEASRASIAAETGLSAAAVTKIVARLGEAELVEERHGLRSGALGRPTAPIALSKGHHLTVGAHIGLRWTTAGVVELDGSVREQRALTHRRKDPAYVLAQAAEAITELSGRASSQARVTGVGVSIGGVVNEGLGVVCSHELLGWRDVAIVEKLEEACGCEITLTQNVRGLAASTLWFGAGKASRDFLLLFVGNVVGMALVVGGNVHAGSSSSAGGVAHLPVNGFHRFRCACGQLGCLQAVASEVAVLAGYRRSSDAGAGGADPPIEYMELVGLLRSGDRAARRLLTSQARAVGRALSTLIALFDPERVFVAGSIGGVPELMQVVELESTGSSGRRPPAVGAMVGVDFNQETHVLSAAAPVLRGLYLDPLGSGSPVR